MPCLELDNTIKLDKDTINSPNLCDRFTDRDLQKLGEWCHMHYDQNEQSRERWYKRSQSALDLAMQLQKNKTFPWQGCSNIAFPLVTIAALQFHSRAYPALIDGRTAVKCRVIGEDPQGLESKRAAKITAHMSWQRLEQDEGWEEDQDRGILNTAIVGCGFAKSYWDAEKNIPVSVFVPAVSLSMDYFSRSVESSIFKTHIIPMWRNELYGRFASGVFRDAEDENWFKADAVIPTYYHNDNREKRTGTEPGDSNDLTPYTMLEHHCWVDLDGDGYAEPYIITTEYDTQYVLRIVARFDREEDIQRSRSGRVITIKATEYFTKKPFIPSPDGGIYDYGFGTLIGPLNESVNAGINQLFDAGTLANTAGGFLGRGAKIRGGNMQFRPFGWNPVESTGDDLRKNIFPLPVREPSSVMFQLLGLLIDFTNRVSGTTELMVGENPGQNTPAETARTMVSQGQKIYSAIFKRLWRAYKAEYKKLYRLNAIYLSSSMRFGAQGEVITRDDYLGSSDGVVPAADPLITSEGEAFAQAQLVREAAMTNPAGYNMDEVERHYLKALKTPDIDRIFPGAEGKPPAEDVKVTIQKMKNELGMAQLQLRQAEIGNTLQETIRLNTAKIMELEASAKKLLEEAGNEKARLQVDAFRASIELLRESNKTNEAQFKSLMEIGRDAALGFGGEGAVPGVVPTPSNVAPISVV